MTPAPFVRTQCVRCARSIRSRRVEPVCTTCEPRPPTTSTNRVRPMVPCGRCGKRIRSQAADPRCADCRLPQQRPAFEATEANRAAAYCELCGRTHAGRWECRERAEKSGEEVRLWMLERGQL